MTESLLHNCMKPGYTEAGCDEAGRGALSGPVVAAAVVLHEDFYHPLLNDSKQLNAEQRSKLEVVIRQEARAYAYGINGARVIEKVNVLQASLQAMAAAVSKLPVTPDYLLIDGPYYLKDAEIPYHCFKGGDAQYASIAAASVLAKTLRDRLMAQLDLFYPAYGWAQNKGYGTPTHCRALETYGPTPYHRKTYKTVLQAAQQKLSF